jgi:uncharacterized protein YlxP (DUF503 family)
VNHDSEGMESVGIVRVTLRLPSRTLKEKRAIVKSVVERLRQRFNASVAEVAHLDDVGMATVAAACISNDGHHVDEQLQSIARAIEEWRLDAEIVDIETELL